MRDRPVRYFIGFLVTIGLVILLIILLLGGGGKPKVPSTTKTLESYASTDAQAMLTIDGPINASQDHEQVRIIVDNQQALYQQISGYDSHVVNQQSFPSTENAFTNFLFALDRAGFTEGDTSPSVSDERGYCPLGDRYIFQLSEDGNTIERFWASECGGTKSYKGDASLTITLFQNQIPNYADLVQNLDI